MKRTFVTKDPQRFSTGRLEALTDGVFAIAMTLLVLDLNVSELGDAVTNEQLWHALAGMQVNLISFIVSFLLLGSMWAVHVRQFEYIKQADRHFTMLNTLRLLVVVFIPFTTSISSAYPDVVIGRILLPLNFLALTIITLWQWDYATRQQADLYTNLSKAEIRRGQVRNLVVLYMSLAVVIVSAFVGQWAFIIFSFMPLAINLFVRHVKTKN